MKEAPYTEILAARIRPRPRRQNPDGNDDRKKVWDKATWKIGTCASCDGANQPLHSPWVVRFIHSQWICKKCFLG